ncbi:MAG: virginiamycin B lyase family protein [Ktedonobacterales bacterium]
MYAIAGFAPGHDGTLWFTYLSQSSHGGLGYITASGKVVFEPAVFLRQVSSPEVGPDGNLWFVEEAFASQVDGTLTVTTCDIVRFTPTNSVSRFPLPILGDPLTGGMISGPKGSLWFTRYSGSPGGDTPDTLGSITPDGVITQYTLPGSPSYVSHLTFGPDGNLWAVEPFQRELLRATPDGQVTAVTIGETPALTSAIASVGGYVWVATQGNVIVRYAL